MSDLDQCLQTQCNYKDQDENIIGIMCGSSRGYCASYDVLCTNPQNEKQSYWSTDTYNGDPDCYSQGKYKFENTCNKNFRTIF